MTAHMLCSTLVHGEAIFVETGREANISDIEAGMIITAGPQSFSPKKSDYTIADIAAKRGGIYSPSAHEMSDPSASEEYIKAHVRRLEALAPYGACVAQCGWLMASAKGLSERAAHMRNRKGMAIQFVLMFGHAYHYRTCPKL